MTRAFVPSSGSKRFGIALAVLAIAAVWMWWRTDEPAPSPRQAPIARTEPAPPTPTPAPAVPPAPALPSEPVLETAEPVEPEPVVEVVEEEPVRHDRRERSGPVVDDDGAEHGVLVGTFVDDARRPIANASCTAGLADQPGIPQAFHTQTTAAGVFEFKRAPIGEVFITCGGGGDLRGRTTTTVAAKSIGTARIEIVGSTRDPRRARSGMTLHEVDNAVRVASIESGGPAAAAGLAIGDTILIVNGRDVREGSAKFMQRHIEIRARDKPVDLVVLRGGKEVSLALTLQSP